MRSVKHTAGANSPDPVKRARSLANLRPNKKGNKRGRHGKGIDGLPATISVHKELVALAREWTAPVMKRLFEIATLPGYKPRDAVVAGDIILSRGWGRAPVLVRVAGDNDSDVKPAIASSSDASRQAFAREVLDCLVSSGSIKLPEGATLKRDDEEVVDAEVVRHVEFPEVLNPARPLSRDELLKSANIEPVVAPTPASAPPPTHYKAGDESDQRCEALIAAATTIDADPSMWRAKMRPMLTRYVERRPDASERVAQAIAILNQRFGA